MVAVMLRPRRQDVLLIQRVNDEHHGGVPEIKAIVLPRHFVREGRVIGRTGVMGNAEKGNNRARRRLVIAFGCCAASRVGPIQANSGRRPG